MRNEEQQLRTPFLLKINYSNFYFSATFEIKSDDFITMIVYIDDKQNM